MKYLLDTDICIEIIRGRRLVVLDRLREKTPGDVGISTISLAELEYGVRRSRYPVRNASALIEFCTPLAVHSFTATAAAVFGRIRFELESRGMQIGPMDTLIAAHAIALDAVLVSNNAKEYRRVSDLQFENWLIESP